MAHALHNYTIRQHYLQRSLQASGVTTAVRAPDVAVIAPLPLAFQGSLAADKHVIEKVIWQNCNMSMVIKDARVV